MDAVEFFKEKRRMCDSFDDHCAGCEIKSAKNGITCGAYIKNIRNRRLPLWRNGRRNIRRKQDLHIF